MKIKLQLVAAILLISFQSIAQTLVRGTVQDDENKALPGVTVSLKQNDHIKFFVQQRTLG